MGTVTDPGTTITGFRVGLDDTALEDFVEVQGVLAADGNFSFTTAELESFNGEPLADGSHTLKLIAENADGIDSG